jgi:hypothetical protein
MMTIFSDYEVIIQYEYAPQSQIINYHFYLQVLRYLCDTASLIATKVRIQRVAI